MLLPDEERGRPLAEERPRNVVTTDIHRVPLRTDDEAQPRCVLCGHVISCEESIRAGIGRDCRRRARRLAREVAA